MAEYTANELRLEIAQILDEAKKKSAKSDKAKRKSASVDAYGLYDEAFDFSSPLGAFNLYRQQGAANWGPLTSDGPNIDSAFGHPNVSGATRMKESDERALRAMVREVIQHGLVPPTSAWSPLIERREGNRIHESAWEEAGPLFEAWYDKFRQSKASESDPKKSSNKAGHEKTKYGPVKKHGMEPKGSKGGKK